MSTTSDIKKSQTIKEEKGKSSGPHTLVFFKTLRKCKLIKTSFQVSNKIRVLK